MCRVCHGPRCFHLEFSCQDRVEGRSCRVMSPGFSSTASKEGGRAGLFSSCTFFLALSASADASSNQASIQLQKLIQDDGGRVVEQFENLVCPQHAFYMKQYCALQPSHAAAACTFTTLICARFFLRRILMLITIIHL